jgi:hypothetical protein
VKEKRGQNECIEQKILGKTLSEDTVFHQKRPGKKTAGSGSHIADFCLLSQQQDPAGAQSGKYSGTHLYSGRVLSAYRHTGSYGSAEMQYHNIKKHSEK